MEPWLSSCPHCAPPFAPEPSACQALEPLEEQFLQHQKTVFLVLQGKVRALPQSPVDGARSAARALWAAPAVHFAA